jgi:endonuclease-3 related protein
VRDIYRILFRRFGPQRWWPGESPLEVAIGAILTQNTAWPNVERAIGNLRRAHLLDVGALLAASPRKIARLVRPAGYFNVKTKRLRAFLVYLREKGVRGKGLTRLCRLDTARLRRELLGVKGIGPETADSILLYAFERPVFVVDAYTKRVFSRHGFFKEDTGYTDVQRFFESRLKRSVPLFNEYHALIVALAKTYCRTQPLCSRCPLRRARQRIH